MRVDNVDYEWYEHHNHKDKTGKQHGTDMHTLHHHTEWDKRKAKHISRGKGKRTSNEHEVTPKPPFNPSPKTSPGKSNNVNGTLVLDKSFELFLATAAQFSNKESDYLYNLAVKGAEEHKHVD